MTNERYAKNDQIKSILFSCLVGGHIEKHKSLNMNDQIVLLKLTKARS